MRDDGHDPALLTALAIGALFIPLLGWIVGTFDMLFANGRRLTQGFWLFLMGCVPMAVLAIWKFS